MTDSTVGAAFRVERRDVLTVLGLVAASYCLYGLLGVRFDTTPFPGYMQFIDIELLRHRLLESIWFYHAHPPLLNLFAGLGVKWFPNHAELFFALCFQLLGAVIVGSVYWLTVLLSASRLAGLAAAAVLAFSPSLVLYQNWFMYTLPSVALLTLAALALHRYAATSSTRWCAAFFSLLAMLLLTRSLFHIAWMVAITLLLTLVLRRRWRQILVCAVVPLTLVALWYGKNLYYFGSFASSSMLGLGVSNIATLLLPRSQLAPLVEQGTLSEFALISRYRQVDLLFAAQQPVTGIPVLDQVKKSSGEYNFNNLQLLIVSRHYTADALVVIRRFPASYVIGLILANRIYFSPASMNPYFSSDNRVAVEPVERWFNVILYGAGPAPRFIEQPHFGFNREAMMEVNTGWLLVTIWWLAIAYAYARARRAVLAGSAEQSPDAIVLGFVVVTALYLYGVSTAVELSENNRYRFNIEPLMIVVVAVAVSAVAGKLRRKWTARASGAA